MTDVPLLRRNPAKSMEKSIVRLAIRFATAVEVQIAPMHRHRAAATILNSTSVVVNRTKFSAAGTNPIIQYAIDPSNIGGIRLCHQIGIISDWVP